MTGIRLWMGEQSALGAVVTIVELRTVSPLAGLGMLASFGVLKRYDSPVALTKACPSSHWRVG